MRLGTRSLKTQKTHHTPDERVWGYEDAITENSEPMDNELDLMQAELQGMTLEELARDIVPIRDTMELLRAKWIVAILTTILRGKNRFRDILELNPGLTDKVLSARLRELLEGRLIEKRELYGYPPRVEYRLTEHGLSLYRVINMMREWGYEHRKIVLSDGKVT